MQIEFPGEQESGGGGGGLKDDKEAHSRQAPQRRTRAYDEVTKPAPR